MFPEKVGVSFANFSVTYHKTYKIVTNMKENKQYLLTQVCSPNFAVLERLLAFARAALPHFPVSVALFFPGTSDAESCQRLGGRGVCDLKAETNPRNLAYADTEHAREKPATDTRTDATAWVRSAGGFGRHGQIQVRC